MNHVSNPTSEARKEIVGRLRRVCDEPRRMFRAFDEIRRPEVPMTVTRAEGEPLSLVQRFGSQLEAVKGSYEIVGDTSDVVARILERVRFWESESDSKQGDDSQPRRILSWDPGELPLPSIGESLAEAGIELFVPNDLHHDADRERAGSAGIGLTGVEAAFASTGSIALAPAQGKSRAASLLPYRHIVLVPTSVIHPSVESWLATLRQDGCLSDLVRDSAQLVFITGPSKSADIELNLTLGVHGPKQIHAIVFDDRQ